MRVTYWYFSAILCVLYFNGFYCKNLLKLIFNLLLFDQTPNIVSSGTPDFNQCPKSTNRCRIFYWLYTQENARNPILLDSFKYVLKNRPIIVLIHGWRGHRDIYYIQDIKNAYLPKMNQNIIIVDYGECVNGDYFSAFCQVPYVSAQLANFICNLTSTLRLSPEHIHLVGHSLGAHVSGLAGDKLKCGKIGRITGLDPAGPLYNLVNSSFRLDMSDALFVDVIHTSQAQFGYTGDCGHVDFYPNCGTFQPGCLEESITKVMENYWENIWKFFIYFARCNHQRSCSLYVDSIKHNNLTAQPCTWGCGLPSPVCGIDAYGEPVYMGHYLTSKPIHAQYSLNTGITP